MKKVHIIFMVCENYHTFRTVPLYNTICKEALRDGHGITLAGGFTNTKDDIPILRVSESDHYVAAVDKLLNSIIYHYSKNTDFDFFMICDDDTFINFSVLNGLLDTLDCSKLAVYGCVRPFDVDGKPHVTGGPGILMNRKTFNILAEEVQKYKIDNVHGDVTLGLYIHSYNKSAAMSDKIEFINIEEFYQDDMHLDTIKKAATYHLRGKADADNELCIYELYDELTSS